MATKNPARFRRRRRGAFFLIVGEDLLPLVDLHKKNIPKLKEIICLIHGDPPASIRSYNKLIQQASSKLPEEPMVYMDDLFILQYTSGMTGFPKGAMHTP